MKSLRTRAIVLRRTNYGEADRIIQLITPSGRFSVIARGVRREKSRLAGGIELFAISDVVLGQGKGDLSILTSARLVQFYRHILEDYDRMQYGYEVIKFVARASEMVDEPEWYDVLAEVLAALDTVTIDLRLIQTWFYVRYASLLGHELGLQYDESGNQLKPDERYSYDTAEKTLRKDERGDITSEHIKLLRLISANSIAKLVQVGGVNSTLETALSTARAHAAI